MQHPQRMSTVGADGLHFKGSVLDQPLFESRAITTTQTITAGRHMFVGTFNPPGATGVNDRTDDGRTWLLFVRALPNEP